MTPPSPTSGLYPLLRPILFQLDPERAHHLAITFLKLGLGPKFTKNDDPVLHTKVCGLNFSNPVGLAGGFDKQAEIIGPVLDLGFGFTEVGSITPLPQPGNPKPRLFRIAEAEAIINRFGMNSDGFDVCLQRIQKWHRAKKPNGIVGINIGKNKESTDAAADYVAGIKKFAAYADYFMLNISSPNTPGMRDLQGREQMADLLRHVIAARANCEKKPPLFVKIAPDLTEPQQDDIVDVVLSSGVDAMIVGNTTVSRPTTVPADIAKETGGLSGKPLYEMSTRLLGTMYQKTKGRIPLIGCGGVSSGADAYAKIRAGASLIQLYSALIYQGPGLVVQIKKEVAALLKRDGFKSVSDAVGVDNKVISA